MALGLDYVYESHQTAGLPVLWAELFINRPTVTVKPVIFKWEHCTVYLITRVQHCLRTLIMTAEQATRLRRAKRRCCS